MRPPFLLSATMLLLVGCSMGAVCPDSKHPGITAVTVLIDDIGPNDTLSLRWQEQFFDAIFKSARYCFVPNKRADESYVTISVSLQDTAPGSLAADRVALSLAAFFTASDRFIGHQLQVCTITNVDSCAQRALTSLDDQIMKFPEAMKPKE